MKFLLEIIQRVTANRTQPWSLATLVATSGSTYRKPGARLLVGPDGATLGVLSGGCLEEEIARHGLEVMRGGEPVLLSFDTRLLYGCDGKVDILVERVSEAGEQGNFITRVGDELRDRRTCRILTRFEGEKMGSDLLPADTLVSEQSGVFIHAVPLPVRLLLIGTGPEIGPLLQLGSSLGWVINCFGHPSEIPDDFKPDSRTAAVVMTHNFGRDLASLDRLFPLRIPYIGLLGPKKRHADLIARLQEYRGVDPAWLQSLHAPAGLDIGSEAPEEIALSIVSEVAAVLSGRRGGFLRERQSAIHAGSSGQGE